MAHRKVIPPILRVERRCVFEDRGYETPCKIFTGCRDRHGYRHITIGSKADGTNRRMLVHRLTYEHYVGPIPTGLELDHLCRQPACCEVTHLEAVTHATNLQRSTWGIRTHCPKGHPYDGDNLYVRVHPSGYTSRTCKTCRREGMRRSQAKKKESSCISP